MTIRRTELANVASYLPFDFMVSFALDNKSICLDESHRKLAVLTELNEYEIIDFDMVEDCQLDIQYRKKTCKKSNKKEISQGCYCDFYLDITLKKHPYQSDISVCLNKESIEMTFVESKDPLVNKEYSKYLSEANKIVENLISKREDTVETV